MLEPLSGPGKRPSSSRSSGQAAHVEPSPKKIAHKSAVLIVEAASIVEPLVSEVKVASCREVWIQRRGEKSILLLNKGPLEVHIPIGTQLVGLGKGKFLLQQEGDELGNRVLFSLTEDDWVILNNGYQTIHDVVAEQRKKKVGAQINYHTCIEDQQQPGKFKLGMTHKIVFVAQDFDEGFRESFHTFASPERLDPKAWGSGCCSTKWVVRWGAKGLQPVKPVVVNLEDLVTPVGSLTS